jgi:hypothetical protein
MPAEPHLLDEVAADFDRLPVLSQIETDRFCEGCGYNLRMQGVRRDPRLNILVVRCPECSRFHPVSTAGTTRQVWWQRLISLVIVSYAVVLASLVLGLGAAQVGIALGSLDELAHRSYSPRGYQYGIPLYERPHDPEYLLLMVLASAGSLAVGYLAVALATVLCHHWRRWGYILHATVFPLAVAATLGVILHPAPARIRDFAYPYCAWFVGLQLLGGVLAVSTGRPVARGLARLLLPPGWRANLAPLWSADGLEPPRKAT